MATYRVFHSTTFPFTPGSWPESYRLVADVEAANVDAAFARTNSVDRHWSLQPGVRCFDPEARSTSVGDVVVSPEGRVFRCAGLGWREL